jgi:hypothetical protein
MYVNIGSAPVFNIALERTLTEIYQGRNDFLYNGGPDKFYMLPYRKYSLEDSIYDNYSSITCRHNYPEEIMLNTQFVSTFNHEIFLSGNEYSNADLLAYCKKINELNDFNIYVRDLSKVQDIKAVRVFCANKLIFPWRYTFCNQINHDVKTKLIECFQKLRREKQYTKEYLDILEEIEIAGKDEKNKTALSEFNYLFLDRNDFIFPTSSLDAFFDYYEENFFHSNTIPKEGKSSFSYFKTLYEYKKCGKYTDEEIINIFTKVYRYTNKE